MCIRVRLEHDWNGDVEGGWNEFGGSEINSVFRFFFFSEFQREVVVVVVVVFRARVVFNQRCLFRSFVECL